MLLLWVVDGESKQCMNRNSYFGHSYLELIALRSNLSFQVTNLFTRPRTRIVPSPRQTRKPSVKVSKCARL